jgi:hypothetical protein
VSAKTFLDHYLSIPAQSYWALPISFFAQLAHVVTILSKLTLFDAHGWDADYVRRYLDLSTILNLTLERFVEASEGFEVDPKTLERQDVFSRIARKIRRVGAWLNARQASGTKLETVQIQTPTGGEQSENMIDGIELDCFLDDAFWQEMVGTSQ